MIMKEQYQGLCCVWYILGHVRIFIASTFKDCLLSQTTVFNLPPLRLHVWKLYGPYDNLWIREWELKKEWICWEICSALKTRFSLLCLDNDILSVFHFFYFCDDSITYVGNFFAIKIAFYWNHTISGTQTDAASSPLCLLLYLWEFMKHFLDIMPNTELGPLGLVLWCGHIFAFVHTAAQLVLILKLTLCKMHIYVPAYMYNIMFA